MDKDFELLSQHLAHNLLELRQRRNLTQVGLAKLTGLPRSTIANLESGGGNPSLSNLARLSMALHIPIEQLLAPQEVVCKLIAAEDIPVQVRSQGNVHLYKLLPDPLPNMDIDRIEVDPGSQMKGTPHPSGTKEYFHCIQGEMTVSVLGNQYKVKKGDVLAFPGEVKHVYQNQGKGIAIGVSVVVLTPIGI
ncbi:MAG: XRE family transcriptional regulator [Bdellovibrionales bacterium]|nr:XRE family transcriptional regulator [Bdellovibrionales bacterium]